MPDCSHQPTTSTGGFLVGHCPECLFAIALGSPIEEDRAVGPATPTLTPGTILSERYRLFGVIGKGGMGHVYRAEDLKLGQPVALKFLSEEMSKNRDALRQLSSEVSLGRQVAHPNVCRLYDLAEADGHHFIVMEHVDGEDLASLLARIGPLSGRKAMEIARDLCAGLAACHEREVVHGDLKPGNVMIDGNGRARIMDFGLATVAGTRPEQRLVAGTLPYMAPEQLHGGSASIQADIYALGLLLYEMFTGRRVHDVQTLDELMRSLETDPPPPSIVARVPPDVEEMILRCLERKPLRRPRSAAEVASVFPSRDPIDAALAAGDTPTPGMIAASETVGDLSVRSGWLLLAAALSSLGLVVAAADQVTAVGRSSLHESPDVLASRAREIARSFGDSSSAADEVFGFTTRGRFRSRGDSPDSTLAFFYRQSSRRLHPSESLRRVGPRDPPFDVAGMITIGLDPAGHLRFYSALPSEARVGDGDRPVNWNALFALASLDPARFTPTDSSWLPPVPHDERRVWRDGGVMVQAAQYGGKPVYFDVNDRAMPPATARTAERRWTFYAQTVYLSLLSLSLIAGGLLAQRNMRRGRSDLRGARRIALTVLFCRLLFWLLPANLASVDINAQFLVRALGQALFESAQVWVAYVALEPFVRRRWPRLIIGWSRLLEGRVSDPLVGRDCLVGGLFGILLAQIEQLRGWSVLRLGLQPSDPFPLTLEMLSGVPEVLAGVFYCVARAIVFALVGLFLFLFIRALINRPAAAGALWIAGAALTWIRAEQLRIVLTVGIIVAIALAALSLFVMMRFGLLAAVMMFFVYLMLAVAPLTADPTRWYGAGTVLPLLVIAVALLFGFRAALARKRLFSVRILEV